jgi:hypothetical protein
VIPSLDGGRRCYADRTYGAAGRSAENAGLGIAVGNGSSVKLSYTFEIVRPVMQRYGLPL